MSGRVVLVGAGPGDPDLLTVRAARELERAEVLLYDALIPPGILALVSPGCERLDVGKRGDGSRGVPQDEIAKILVEKARAGHYVVRLKGGDPFLFGRGGEEADELARAGIPFEVVPGISSALAVPAYAGIPLTDRRASSSVAIVTGHRASRPDVNRVDWEGLAQSAETLVVLMGTTWLPEIAQRLLAAGRAPDTPAAAIADGATGAQRVVYASLAELPDAVQRAGLRAPTVVVVGEVAGLGESLRWYERRPLFGRRVLVLREAEQAAGLVAELARRGALPVSVPLLSFEASGEPEALRAAEPDWLVFGSSNAVRFAAPHLGESGRRARVACMGAATAERARRAGLRVDVAPEAPRPESLADAMNAHFALRGCRVLVPRARDAREELPVALEARGAEVERVEVYRSVLPDGAGALLREALADGVDAVLLTSPSTVERLACLLGESEFAAFAERAALVCMGPTTRDALRALGVESVAEAEEFSAVALVEALERHLEEVDALSQ